MRFSGFVLLRDNENDIKFINRRNFWVEQAFSAEVIYNDAVHTQRDTADSAGNQTQRYYLCIWFPVESAVLS